MSEIEEDVEDLTDVNMYVGFLEKQDIINEFEVTCMMLTFYFS